VTELEHDSSHHVIIFICYTLVTLQEAADSAEMQIPPVTELEEAAKKLVWAAKKKGTLKFVQQHINSLINDKLDILINDLLSSGNSLGVYLGKR
jgi:hypothetical protein